MEQQVLSFLYSEHDRDKRAVPRPPFSDERSARSQDRIDERLARSQEKLDKRLAHSEENRARSRKETDEALRDLARINKQLGELGNRFGGFTEGMALPSVREILYETFGVDSVVADARRNGSSLQIDAVGIANGDVGKVYLVEIKSRLREEGLPAR